MFRSLAVTLFLTCAFVSRASAQTVTLDSARHVVVMRAGPFTAEPADHGGHHGHAGHVEMLHGDDLVRRFEWPCDAWLRGFALRLEDAEGRPLPLRWIHHLKVVNFARRQLVYPITERLIAVAGVAGPEAAGHRRHPDSRRRRAGRLCDVGRARR